MQRPHPKFLLAAGLFALPAAATAPTLLPVGAGIAAAGVLFALLAPFPWRRAGLAALPALLAAVPPRSAEPALPRPGPVRVRGAVTGLVHDPLRGRVWLKLRAGPTELGVGCAAPVDALPGDRVDLLAHLSPPIAPGTRPTLQAAAASVRVTPAARSLPRLLHRARALCERQLLRLLPDDRGALLATLVLGRATRAPGPIAEAHRATGLSHLLAVSGAHAAMLGLMLGLGGAGRGRRLGVGRPHLLAALLALFAYAGITGGEPPVVRAVLMYVLAALAVQTGRPLSLLAGLMVPALVTAACAPRALAGPSFQLSYAAVYGLSLARARGTSGLRRFLLLPLAASFWAACTTAPLTLWWFGQIAPWTILLTPVLAPLVAALLVLGLGAALAGNLAPGLADPAAPLLGWLLDLYVGAVELADLLPGTPVRARCVPPPWFLGLALLAAGAVWLRWRSRAGVVTAVGLLVVPWLLPLPRPVAPRLVLFAVGHGQATLLETAAGARVAIDCGSLQQPRRAARLITEALAVRTLDWLVVTHADCDHHNGIPALLRRVAVRRAVLPGWLADSGLARRLRRHGAHVELLAQGGVRRLLPELTVAAPRQPASASANDRGLWVDIACAGTRVLLTGDAQTAGIGSALVQGLARKSDVLVLPHHGRADPAAPALLRAVAPATCLASAAGADGETALGDLVHRAGADLWVTGMHGDLEVRFGERLTVAASAAPAAPCDTNLVHRRR